MERERINSSNDLQNILATAPSVSVQGGGTKSALQPLRGVSVALDLSALSGILEYEPGEFTFTALAGTPLTAVATTLAEHGQYLPFDPLLIHSGATLGGTVAAGLSGSGRYRFGGVRDFLIGVRFVDGLGRLVRGGGKVVKNAAGFDLPKLMVGSLGQFGILTEVSFKVFPQPEAYTTVQSKYPTLAEAQQELQRIVDSHLDIHALDLQVNQNADEPPHYTVVVRLGGLRAVLPQRADQLRQRMARGEVLAAEEDSAYWSALNELHWAAAAPSLVKVALTPGRIAQLEEVLSAAGAQRHYAVGGNLAWIAWSNSPEELDQSLERLGLAGLLLRGDHPTIYLGKRNGHPFAERIKSALDPRHCLPNYL